ncbi:MAG: hypothetical protein ACJZ8O_02005 [Pirellulaceae bacterium]
MSDGNVLTKKIAAQLLVDEDSSDIREFTAIEEDDVVRPMVVSVATA